MPTTQRFRKAVIVRLQIVYSLAAAIGAADASVAALPPAPAGVQTSTENGIEFSTIGDPGNRPTGPQDERWGQGWVFGSVPYEYRMARTELTVGQWLEFIKAYDVFNDPPRVNGAFHGDGIVWNILQGGWVNTVPLDFPATMSWEYAARYCNWLHNDKAMTPQAFERGVYDASTFTYNPDGSANHQQAHDPAARFWIPTNDEWTKAAYWDPNKLGPGQGGYWYYPGGSDDLLISGPPGVGQTSGGLNSAMVGVASYPDVLGPWGLFDTSGGVFEYTETIGDPFGIIRTRRGSRAFPGTDHSFNDALEFPSHATVRTPDAGLRIATRAVPEPGMCTLFVIAFAARQRRSRHVVHSKHCEAARGILDFCRK